MAGTASGSAARFILLWLIGIWFVRIRIVGIGFIRVRFVRIRIVGIGFIRIGFVRFGFIRFISSGRNFHALFLVSAGAAFLVLPALLGLCGFLIHDPHVAVLMSVYRLHSDIFTGHLKADGGVCG